MARRMVGDDQDVYRVKIVRRAWRLNPDYKQGVWDSDGDNPRSRYDGPEESYFYGPYNTLGAAKGQLTSNAYGYDGLREGVVSAVIQKAHTTWEDVQ